MSLEDEVDFSAEFAAEDEAIERVSSELREMNIDHETVTEVEQTLREHPGPYLAKDFSVLADPEKVWKVVRRRKGPGLEQRAA